MTESKLEALIGFFVLIITGSFLFWLLQASDTLPRGASYALVAEFTSAKGVAVGTDVRIAGIKVGNVDKMELNPDTYQASVHLSVDSDIELSVDTLFAVSTESLLGGNFIEIFPGIDDQMLKPGERALFTQSDVDFLTLLAQSVGDKL